MALFWPRVAPRGIGPTYVVEAATSMYVFDHYFEAVWVPLGSAVAFWGLLSAAGGFSATRGHPWPLMAPLGAHG